MSATGHYGRVAECLDALEALGNRATTQRLREYLGWSGVEVAAKMRQAVVDDVAIRDGGGVWQVRVRARRRAAQFDLGGKGTRFVVKMDGEPVGCVRATGRKRAMTAVAEKYGGERQTTGSFGEVLIGSSLGGTVRIEAPGDHAAFERAARH